MDSNNHTSLSTARVSFEGVANWATRTPTAYSFTVVLLFALGLFGRFIGAVKSQLEQKWKTHEDTYTLPEDHDGHDRDENEEYQPLKPDVPLASNRKHRTVGAFWVADEAWNVKRDGIRGCLEFARAIVVYTLMLAVMTYDVGFFFSVTLSVLAGEFVFGRYSRHTHG